MSEQQHYCDYGRTEGANLLEAENDERFRRTCPLCGEGIFTTGVCAHLVECLGARPKQAEALDQRLIAAKRLDVVWGFWWEAREIGCYEKPKDARNLPTQERFDKFCRDVRIAVVEEELRGA